FSKCSDAKLEGEIGLAIITAGVQELELNLSHVLRQHLERCESCRSQLQVWKNKAKSARRAKESYDIVNKAAGGDPSILRKSGKSGTGYFKQIGEKGLFVLVTVDNVILNSEEISLEEFNRLIL